MPPEYAAHGSFSIKSDVFSFGVVVLEIISGRKNHGFRDPLHRLNLLGHVSFDVYMFLYLATHCIYFLVAFHIFLFLVSINLLHGKKFKLKTNSYHDNCLK
jgi:hypothetical protein